MISQQREYVGLALAPSAPTPDATAADIARHYFDNGAAVLTSALNSVPVPR